MSSQIPSRTKLNVVRLTRIFALKSSSLQLRYTSSHHNFLVSLNLSFALGFLSFLLSSIATRAVTPACILSRSLSLLKRLFTKWKSSSSSSFLCLLLFKVIKALLARSAILFVYLPGWHYETSVLRVRQTKKRTNISVMLANIYLLLSFLLSKFSFSCLRLRFHLCFIFTLTNKKTSVFRIILLVFPRFYTVVVILKT